ncbi:uncharacterized protein LOC110884375 isoform X2 [Helianthus annuus]|uniref:uncharacterized protein LOC110884375 isoform X2 n=1 Tax=Helianthus annuus TaxID=4232 RepID=UPI000B8FE7DC|nr:uncharacterized protein LOC110884375 isoform X2 [Helianthus annuus]
MPTTAGGERPEKRRKEDKRRPEERRRVVLISSLVAADRICRAGAGVKLFCMCSRRFLPTDERRSYATGQSCYGVYPHHLYQYSSA